jgi:hypothetical protein
MMLSWIRRASEALEVGEAGHPVGEASLVIAKRAEGHLDAAYAAVLAPGFELPEGRCLGEEAIEHRLVAAENERCKRPAGGFAAAQAEEALEGGIGVNHGPPGGGGVDDSEGEAAGAQGRARQRAIGEKLFEIAHAAFCHDRGAATSVRGRRRPRCRNYAACFLQLESE